MNKLLISCIILFLILTTAITIIKPKMHKAVVFSPKQTIVENISEQITEQETQIVHIQQYEEDKNIEFKPQKTEFSEQIIKRKEQPFQSVQQAKQPQQKTQNQNKDIKVSEPKPQTQQKQKYELPKSVMDIVNSKTQPTKQPDVITRAPEPTAKPIPADTPKPQQIQPVPEKLQNNAPLTEAEEIIVWNKWRSDLQNKVMRDSRVAAPKGTVFRFSFTVNKFGQISNLKIWSDTPAYTNYAVQSLKPLLLSYQGKPILNFPARTKRITTNVQGAFVISNQDRLTSPKDYNDIERVRQ